MSVYVLVAIVKKKLTRRFALHFATDIVCHSFREDALAVSLFRQQPSSDNITINNQLESVRVLTGQLLDHQIKQLGQIAFSRQHQRSSARNR